MARTSSRPNSPAGSATGVPDAPPPGGNGGGGGGGGGGGAGGGGYNQGPNIPPMVVLQPSPVVYNDIVDPFQKPWDLSKDGDQKKWTTALNSTSYEWPRVMVYMS